MVERAYIICGKHKGTARNDEQCGEKHWRHANSVCRHHVRWWIIDYDNEKKFAVHVIIDKMLFSRPVCRNGLRRKCAWNAGLVTMQLCALLQSLNSTRTATFNEESASPLAPSNSRLSNTVNYWQARSNHFSPAFCTPPAELTTRMLPHKCSFDKIREECN
jgi:hypothetical protein